MERGWPNEIVAPKMMVVFGVAAWHGARSSTRRRAGAGSRHVQIPLDLVEDDATGEWRD